MTKDEIATLQGALAGAWPFLKPWLEQCKMELTNLLISCNDEETRGRIKQLDDILKLPERLQNESIGFQHLQEEEGLS